jgi:acetyl/propionyl-CoA carboxylase alpha subunit
MATSRSEPPPSLRKDGGPPFRRVLVANRGEIAVRIIRACHESGMEAIAVYSDPDATARHVRMADRAIRIGPASPMESYLRIDGIVEAAVASGAEAVHPGYGFLAERAAFARAVEAADVAFVGPPSVVIEALGDKLHARRIARDIGVDTVPGTLEPAAVERPDQVAAVLTAAEAIGYPLLVKAAAGGGGRGMRRVAAAADLPAALADGSREAASAFGDGSVYLEREIDRARHVEVQLLGDASGRVVAIGERDCSLQRRHQKLVEEAPAPGLTTETRRRLHDLAARLGTAAGLQNAATVEFLLAPDGSFLFLEANTRLQVEHGITELVSGLDIVREQFSLAAGRPLSAEANAAAGRAADPAGHAIEVRLTAEDPSRDFSPTPGRIRHWIMPSGPGVRVDTAFEAGDRVPPEYDNLMAKIMVLAATREDALGRLRRALDETEVGGVQTTLPFHRFVARDASFDRAELSTAWVVERWNGTAAFAQAARAGQLAAGLDALRTGVTGGPAGAGTLPSAHPRPAAAHDAGNGRWAAAGRQAAIDRWRR